MFHGETVFRGTFWGTIYAVMVAAHIYVVVVVPINAYIHKTKHVTEKHRIQIAKRLPARIMWHFHLQNHDRDDDRDHPHH